MLEPSDLIDTYKFFIEKNNTYKFLSTKSYPIDRHVKKQAEP
jgi:hypothetical protein